MSKEAYEQSVGMARSMASKLSQSSLQKSDSKIHDDQSLIGGYAVLCCASHNDSLVILNSSGVPGFG